MPGKPFCQQLSPLLRGQLKCIQKCLQITPFCNITRIGPGFIMGYLKNGWMGYSGFPDVGIKEQSDRQAVEGTIS